MTEETGVSTIKALSSASGLSPEKIKEIWEEVKANRVKLDSCQGPHQFTVPANKREFADDFLCKLCGGKIDSVNKTWYERGLEHGSKA